MEAGRTDEARTLARFAVEELPGNEPLMAWGAGLATGQASELDLRAMVLDLPPDAGRSDEAPHSAGAPAVPPDREAGEHPPGDQPSARPPVAGDEDHAGDIEAVGDGRNAGSEAESDDSQRASGEQHSADAQHV